jgi:hypothetical protein
MRSCAYALLVGILAVLSGCAPVYVFRVPSDVQADTTSLQARLREFLESKGLEPIGRSEAMVGPTGCGRGAPDRNAFGRFWQDSWGINRRLVVHEFTCDGAWQIVIISSTDAEAEARQLRDGLKAEFASEIASGSVQVETRCRTAFE